MVYFYLPKETPIATIINPTARGIWAFATSLFRLFDNEQTAINKRAVDRIWSKKSEIWLTPWAGNVPNIPAVDRLPVTYVLKQVISQIKIKFKILPVLDHHQIDW